MSVKFLQVDSDIRVANNTPLVGGLKPYKQQLDHKWIVGNALAEMNDIEDVSLIIADPPYGQFPLINLAINLSREICDGPSFFFMYAEDLLNLDSIPDQILFWCKSPSTKNTKKRYSRFVEIIAAYDLDKGPFNQDTHWTTRSGTFIDQLTYRTYEFQKPVSLIEKLLAVNSNEGDLILDPFAGSGSTRKACENMNRNSISIEIQRDLAQ